MIRIVRRANTAPQHPSTINLSTYRSSLLLYPLQCSNTINSSLGLSSESTPAVWNSPVVDRSNLVSWEANFLFFKRFLKLISSILGKSKSCLSGSCFIDLPIGSRIHLLFPFGVTTMVVMGNIHDFNEKLAFDSF